jgi:uncharacterized membrane protein (UPF0127 family)
VLPTLVAMARSLAAGVLLAVCCLASCEKADSSGGPAKNNPSPPTNDAVSAAGHLNHAQPKLRTMKLWLGAKEIAAELAITKVQIMTGMMFRKEMGEDEGMLFVFAQPQKAAFYMRNTYVPLSVAYIDTQGVIAEIHDLEPLNENPVFAKTDNIQFVLEMRRGWFERNGIATGAVVRTEHGSLPETFFKKRGSDL